MTDIDQADIKLFLETNDSSAFERLLLKYQDRVYNFCLRYLGNEADASDCTQEIFIRLYENLHSFRFESKFSTWLYRITTNTCKNMTTSKHFRIQRHTQSINSNRITNNQQPITNNYPNPHEVLQGMELSSILQLAIDTLKGRQKTVLILRDLDGHSYEEIATITGLKLGTVRSTLNRARLKVAGIISNKLER
ncbi:MAG: sigma-70 family RNA polymerase sigma factor [Bacteroidota bacterium]|nr:sigma-70 family RNA polymerase sigma factor [Bacteroidota bacterium]